MFLGLVFYYEGKMAEMLLFSFFFNICSSFIQNHPKLETTQISFNGWKLKQTVVHLYIGTLLSYEKQPEWISKTYWKKPVSRDYILYDAMDVTFQNRQIFRNGEQIGVCQRLGWSKGLTTKRWHQRIFWVMELLCSNCRGSYTNVLKQNCTYKKVDFYGILIQSF